MEAQWSRFDDPDHAMARIFAGAEKAFCELGVSKVGMSHVAHFAGCSRGTLYRYFKTRHDLHVAYVRHTARDIQRRVYEGVSGIVDPRERLVEFMLRSLREVRDNPAAIAWFLPSAAGAGTRMSRSSEVAAALTTAFAADLPKSTSDGAGTRLQHRWIVRVIVSLLSDPGESEVEERILIERFVVPTLLGVGAGDSDTRETV